MNMEINENLPYISAFISFNSLLSGGITANYNSPVNIMSEWSNAMYCLPHKLYLYFFKTIKYIWNVLVPIQCGQGYATLLFILIKSIRSITCNQRVQK